MSIIRIAKDGDTAFIQYLISRSIGRGDFLLPRNEEEIAELIKQKKFYVAAEVDKVIGCASLEEYDGIAELRSLAVEMDWSRKGIGKRLIRAIELLAMEKYDSIYAFADEDLVEYYKGQGFEDRGRFIGEDGKALDINSGISQKLEKYCLGCVRYRKSACNEHLMHKQFSSL